MNELLHLVTYHRWATERTLEAVAALTEAQYTQVIPSSFPSVRDTLVHMLGADRAWLGRLEGQSPARLEPSEYPNLAQLRTDWTGILERWPVVIAGFHNENAPITYRSFAGEPFTSTLSEIVRHVINHGSYHRGQVTTMLRQLGANTVSTDMIAFTRQNASR